MEIIEIIMGIKVIIGIKQNSNAISEFFPKKVTVFCISCLNNCHEIKAEIPGPHINSEVFK